MSWQHLSISAMSQLLPSFLDPISRSLDYFRQHFFAPNFFRPKFFLDLNFFPDQNFFSTQKIFLTHFFQTQNDVWREKTKLLNFKLSKLARAKVLLKLEFDTEDQVLFLLKISRTKKQIS